MALLEVLTEVETENRSSLTRFITFSFIEMSSNEVINFSLTVKHALSEVEGGKVFISRRAQFLIQDLLAIQHKLLKK